MQGGQLPCGRRCHHTETPKTPTNDDAWLCRQRPDDRPVVRCFAVVASIDAAQLLKLAEVRRKPGYEPLDAANCDFWIEGCVQRGLGGRRVRHLQTVMHHIPYDEQPIGPVRAEVGTISKPAKQTVYQLHLHRHPAFRLPKQRQKPLRVLPKNSRPVQYLGVTVQLHASVGMVLRHQAKRVLQNDLGMHLVDEEREHARGKQRQGGGCCCWKGEGRGVDEGQQGGQEWAPCQDERRAGQLRGRCSVVSSDRHNLPLPRRRDIDTNDFPSDDLQPSPLGLFQKEAAKSLSVQPPAPLSLQASPHSLTSPGVVFPNTLGPIIHVQPMTRQAIVAHRVVRPHLPHRPPHPVEVVHASHEPARGFVGISEEGIALLAEREATALPPL
mmetsp:Transcript_7203/g.20781  ORF Transcript_7203/g.20781 Transcript_7203/m.20781 type:complete len:383 (+) Transcript_7203:286-1434(+)